MALAERREVRPSDPFVAGSIGFDTVSVPRARIRAQCPALGGMMLRVIGREAGRRLR